MPKSTATRNDVLLKIFHDIDFSWDAITAISVALHTADPGIGGTQSTSEATYGGYARQSILRDATGWDVVGNAASNDDLFQFPVCSSGSNTITHVSLGINVSGAVQIIYSGALNVALAVSAPIQPQFAAGALVASET